MSQVEGRRSPDGEMWANNSHTLLNTLLSLEGIA